MPLLGGKRDSHTIQVTRYKRFKGKGPLRVEIPHKVNKSKQLHNRPGLPLASYISRLDRLLLLLDTGSTASVRNTAAKQLAQLAAKSVTGDAAFTEEDLKSKPQHGAFCEPSAWAELMAVVARVCIA
ncbi:hypothetical protein H0H93_011262 [Arthromyces matolae]|nr:hypothetical protein H0H93_011262 [Arthromyces matolae]